MNRFPFIIPLLLASLCAAQPATQPTLGQQVDLQLAAEKAQVQSVMSQLLAAQQALKNIGNIALPGSDLTAQIVNAKQNGALILLPGATYPPITTVSLKAANFKLIGFGNAVVINAAPGASSGISVEAPNFEVSGLSMSGTAVAFKVRANATGFYIHDCSADKQQEFVNVDAGADGGRIVNCTIGKTGGTNVFCSARNWTIDNLTSGGSLGEQCIRIDGKPQRPGNIKIIGCNLTNQNGMKEVITARECDGIFVLDTSIDGYCSFGQGGDTGHNDVTGVRMTNDIFKTLRPGGALVQCQAGVDALIDEPTFPGSATDAAFTIFQRGSIQYRNIHVIGTQSKPIAFANQGGTVQDVTPTTQPSH